MQGYDFHQRVRDTYLQLAMENKSRFYIIDSTKNITDIQNEIITIMDKALS